MGKPRKIRVVPPVQGGYHWWAVNDLGLNKNLATLSADLPLAKGLANLIKVLAAHGIFASLSILAR